MLGYKSAVESTAKWLCNVVKLIQEGRTGIFNIRVANRPVQSAVKYGGAARPTVHV